MQKLIFVVSLGEISTTAGKEKCNNSPRGSVFVQLVQSPVVFLTNVCPKQPPPHHRAFYTTMREVKTMLWLCDIKFSGNSEVKQFSQVKSLILYFPSALQMDD